MCKEKFEHTGWILFLEKFKGCHEGVYDAFNQIYDCEYVHLGGLQLDIIEATIEEATRFLVVGEKYFKGVNINKEICRKFLEPRHLNPEWSKGIPSNWIKEEYRLIINSLQIFLACEGRYVITFLYHLRLLLHFKGGQ